MGAALCCWLVAAASLPASAAAQCQLCAPDVEAAAAKPAPKPITIQIDAGVDFAKIGLRMMQQGGVAQINPVTGQRTLSGTLVDLGGLPVVGTVVIRGEPKGHVEVSFPTKVLLYNSTGASYPLLDFTTTLKNNPKLGDDGVLRFTFAGRLQIDGSAVGTFRGGIPITVDYR